MYAHTRIRTFSQYLCIRTPITFFPSASKMDTNVIFFSAAQILHLLSEPSLLGGVSLTKRIILTDSLKYIRTLGAVYIFKEEVICLRRGTQARPITQARLHTLNFHNSPSGRNS